MTDARQRPMAEARERLRRAYDPETFRAEGHALVDRLARHLSAMMDRAESPVFPPRSPEETLTRWAAPGDPGTAAEGVDASPEPGAWADPLLAGAHHLHHPRSMGHQVPPPMPAGALADALMAFLNNSAAIYELNPAHMAIERRLIRWMADRVGMPAEGDGFFTSGGTLGNLTALLACRQSTATDDAWGRGSFGAEATCVLANEHAHYCVARAVQIMGWGTDGVVPVAVDESFRMTRPALEAALDEARRRGRRPVAVAANACSTATGSFDDLAMVAAFCRDHGLWFHVDGAHGASACLAAETRELVRGLEEADSLVWDVHKMMALPALCTAVLFRDGRRSWETFRPKADYLFGDDPSREWYNGGTRTLECTRPALALKLWTALTLHGEETFADYVRLTFDLARCCADLVKAAVDFELALPVQSNILCFRHRPPEGEDPDAHQCALRKALVDGGRFYVVQTVLHGRTWLRCALMNPLTTPEDFAALLEELRSLA